MLREIAEALRNAEKIVIASHINPEADAIGSAMTLALALDRIGKKPYVYNASGVPRNLLAFHGSGRIASKPPAWEPDLLAVLDCGDLDRIGDEAKKAFSNVKSIINIDHHPTNDRFGHIRWIDPLRSCTGEMIAELVDEMKIDWSVPMAEWTLAAIYADTGSFQFSNARTETFELAGEMVKRGGKPHVVARRMFGNMPVGNLKLLAKVLNTLEIHEDLKAATVVVNLKMFEETKAGPDAVEGFVQFPGNLDGIEVAVLLRQTAKDKYKISMRSKGDLDVGAISQSFGGGGHRQAAGFSVEGDLEDVKRRILTMIEKAQGV